MPYEIDERSGHPVFTWLLRLAGKFNARRASSTAAIRAVRQPLPHGSEPCTARIISTAAETLDLAAIARSLVPQPGMLDPRFFLASFSPRMFKPCVIVVSKGRRVAGLFYGRERLIAGIPTGIVLGDDTLDSMVVARPDEAESVMQCALEALLKHKAALRFRLASDSLALLQAESSKANAEIHFYREEHHAHLVLPGTYDEFLAKFRSHTRHNFCRYRRRSEIAGNEFCFDLPFTDFCDAAKRLFPKEAYARHKSNFRQCLAMIEAMPSRILVGIRRSSGEWISLAGGWYAGDRVVLNMQLNDRSCGRESISLVLRSYLIEQLINRGVRELVFWGGTSAPLNSYITHCEEYMTYVDSRSHSWRLVRLACVALAKLAPATFSKWLKWETSPSNEKMSA